MIVRVNYLRQGKIPKSSICAWTLGDIKRSEFFLEIGRFIHRLDGDAKRSERIDIWKIFELLYQNHNVRSHIKAVRCLNSKTIRGRVKLYPVEVAYLDKALTCKNIIIFK